MHMGIKMDMQSRKRFEAKGSIEDSRKAPSSTHPDERNILYLHVGDTKETGYISTHENSTMKEPFLGQHER